MANMTATEQGLVEALNQWTTKQGIYLVQANPFLFMQVLREQGLEIVNANELTKIRYNHKYLRQEIENINKIAIAAKVKLQQLDDGIELLKEPRTTEPKTSASKPAPKKVPTGERPPRKV